MKKIIVSIFAFAAFLLMMAQTNYIPPTDTLVQQKLQQWQDLSSACSCIGKPTANGALWKAGASALKTKAGRRKGPFSANYFEYKKAYENLQSSFNPQIFILKNGSARQKMRNEIRSVPQQNTMTGFACSIQSRLITRSLPKKLLSQQAREAMLLKKYLMHSGKKIF